MVFVVDFNKKKLAFENCAPNSLQLHGFSSVCPTVHLPTAAVHFAYSTVHLVYATAHLAYATVNLAHAAVHFAQATVHLG